MPDLRARLSYLSGELRWIFISVLTRLTLSDKVYNLQSRGRWGFRQKSEEQERTDALGLPGYAFFYCF